MALPKLLQKLFTNGGAGDKLNQDIIPDIPYSKITDVPSITVDSALSSTSENPVQNKVVKSALDGKLSTSGGTMTGDIIFSSSAKKIASYQNDGGMVEINQWGATLQSNQNDFQGGATLLLRSSTYGVGQSGNFNLISALSPDQRYDLLGKPDGSLTWGGHNVLTVVAESYSANSWYRKYSDGWIEQGGTFTARADWKDGSKNVALPIAFSSACYSVAVLHEAASASGETGGDDSRVYTTTIWVSNVTNTNVVFTWSTSGGNGVNDYAGVSLTASLYMCGK